MEGWLDEHMGSVAVVSRSEDKKSKKDRKRIGRRSAGDKALAIRLGKKGSAKGTDKFSSASASSGDEGGANKCWVCKQKREPDLWKACRKWCLICRRVDERLQTCARQQGETEWYDDLKASDPNAWSKLLREYEKSAQTEEGRRGGPSSPCTLSGASFIPSTARSPAASAR